MPFNASCLRFFFVFFLFVFYSFCLLFIVVLFGETKQNQGRGLVDHKLVQSPTPSDFARPLKAALLFWFFGDFKYGVLLCFGNLVL